MGRKMLKLIPLIIVILFIYSCENKCTKNMSFFDKALNDTIKFKYEGFNYGMSLHLYGEKKFKYRCHLVGCTGGGFSESVLGNFTIQNHKLLLNPDSMFYSELPSCSHSNWKRFILKYGADSLKIKTEYDFVFWGNTIFLLSSQKDHEFISHPVCIDSDLDVDSIASETNDWFKFAEDFNMGYDQIYHNNYMTLQLGSIPKLAHSKFNLKLIPIQWKYLFLLKPVEATILKITKEKRDFVDLDWGYRYKIKLNKGKNDNLRIGISFFGENENQIIKLVQVDSNSSIGYTLDDFKIGEKVKTEMNKK